MGGGGTMSGIEKIPAEMRWMIATRAANDLPFAYSLAFKKVVGEMYEHELSNAMNEIWAAAGSEQGVLAKAFGLPVHSAKSVADAFSTLSVLFMGPEMDNGGIKVKKGDTAVLTLESCPMVNRARAMGIDEKTVFPSCRTYTDAAVASINPAYRISFAKGICTGDTQCEWKVEKKS